MKPPKLSKRELRTKMIGVWVTPSEFESFLVLSNKMGMSCSGYGRALVQRALGDHRDLLDGSR